MAKYWETWDDEARDVESFHSEWTSTAIYIFQAFETQLFGVTKLGARHVHSENFGDHAWEKLDSDCGQHLMNPRYLIVNTITPRNRGEMHGICSFWGPMTVIGGVSCEGKERGRECTAEFHMEPHFFWGSGKTISFGYGHF